MVLDPVKAQFNISLQDHEQYTRKIIDSAM